VSEITIKEIDVILCDLGGVVIELGTFPAMETSRLRDPWSLWLHSEAVRLHESGQLHESEFVPRAINEFQLQVSEEEFLTQFMAWPGNLYPKARDHLKHLADHCHLVSLSNTNRIHWQTFSGWTDFLSLFHHHLPSFETGLLKPDVEVFVHAVNELGCDPIRTLFVDDNVQNVTAAKMAGLHGLQLQGQNALTDLLVQTGLK